MFKSSYYGIFMILFATGFTGCTPIAMAPGSEMIPIVWREADARGKYLGTSEIGDIGNLRPDSDIETKAANWAHQNGGNLVYVEIIERGNFLTKSTTKFRAHAYRY